MPLCVRLCSGLLGSVLRARDARPAGWRGRRSRKSLSRFAAVTSRLEGWSFNRGRCFALFVVGGVGRVLDVRPR